MTLTGRKAYHVEKRSHSMRTPAEIIHDNIEIPANVSISTPLAMAAGADYFSIGDSVFGDNKFTLPDTFFGK
jgi:hypothetical protein